jgi:hypothetical protein
MSENPQHVISEQERRWLEENREAIASINAFIERHGLLADRLRLRAKHAAPVIPGPERSEGARNL